MYSLRRPSPREISSATRSWRLRDALVGEGGGDTDLGEPDSSLGVRGGDLPNNLDSWSSTSFFRWSTCQSLYLFRSELKRVGETGTACPLSLVLAFGLDSFPRVSLPRLTLRAAMASEAEPSTSCGSRRLSLHMWAIEGDIQQTCGTALDLLESFASAGWMGFFPGGTAILATARFPSRLLVENDRFTSSETDTEEDGADGPPETGVGEFDPRSLARAVGSTAETARCVPAVPASSYRLL